MANFFHVAVTGTCFTLQEIKTTDYFHSLIFCSKCQCLLKNNQEHYKLKPSLPTKTIQEAAPLFPS